MPVIVNDSDISHNDCFLSVKAFRRQSLLLMVAEAESQRPHASGRLGLRGYNT